MLYFSKFLVAKNSMNNREGKYYGFLSKSFCLTVTEKFVVNPSVLCFRKFPVAKSFWIRRGEYQDFPSNFFCVTVPKTFVREPFIVTFFFGYRKILCFRGLCHNFLSIFLVSQY